MNDFSIQTEDSTLVFREAVEDFRLSLCDADGCMQITLSLNDVILLHNNLTDVLETYVNENLS